MQVHKGQTHKVGYTVHSRCQCKKGQTPHSGYTVRSRCQCKKVIWLVGDHYLQYKQVNPHTVGTQYTLGTQYAVGVSAKRSIHTVDLANMGGGDRNLQCKKVIVNPHAVDAVGCTVCSRFTVHSRCQCKKVNSHSGLSKYLWWGLLPLVQKGHCTSTQWTQ